MGHMASEGQNQPYAMGPGVAHLLTRTYESNYPKNIEACNLQINLNIHTRLASQSFTVLMSDCTQKHVPGTRVRNEQKHVIVLNDNYRPMHFQQI